MWTDELTVKEAEYTEKALETLESVEWAAPLIREVRSRGISSAIMPLLFEVRFAYEVHLAGAEAVYEHGAGIGGSSIDFRIISDPEWHVELVSLRETLALKDATIIAGGLYETVLSTNAENEDHSEEAEMIRAQMKIGEKVLSGGMPTKFPLPERAIHLVLADMRGYLGMGGDAYDYAQMATGATAISNPMHVRYWKSEPIKGLFEFSDSHPLNAAEVAQERLHFIGFVAEREYRPGEIRERAVYVENPALVPRSDLKGLVDGYPLRPRDRSA